MQAGLSHSAGTLPTERQLCGSVKEGRGGGQEGWLRYNIEEMGGHDRHWETERNGSEKRECVIIIICLLAISFQSLAPQ